MVTSRLAALVNRSSHALFLKCEGGSPGDLGDLMLAPGHGAPLAPDYPLTPIVSNAAEAAGRRLELEVGDLRIRLWQQAASAGDDRIFYASGTDGAAPADAALLPGLEALGREENRYELEVGSDGRLSGRLLGAGETMPAVADAPSGEGEDARPRDFLDNMYNELQTQPGSFDNITYGISHYNRLDTGDGHWLLQSPVMWGKDPAKLAAKHSDFLAERIRKTIEKADFAVDITTLYPAPHRGVFFDELAAALSKLVEKRKPIVVRILIGHHMLPENTEALLQALVRKVPSLAGSKLKVFAAAMTTSLDLSKPTPIEKSWNHSKIVAIDGRWAIVGGHNLWDHDYLCAAPTHDVSMSLHGMAAWFAHRYCNRLWAYVSKHNSHEWWPISRVWSNHYDGPSSTFGDRSFPTVEMLPENSRPGATKVLTVGRLGHGLLDDGSRANHADLALRRAIEKAEHSVRLSLQDIAFVYPIPPRNTFWPADILKALAGAVLKEVDVSIVLSSPGAKTGSGEDYSSGISLDTVWSKIAYEAHLEGCEQCGTGEMSHEEVVWLTREKLRIVPFRFAARVNLWPGLRNPLCGQASEAREIANHAKVMIIDDKFFYIGSQNLYTSDHQEYGWIVGGQKETAELVEKYWGPLWEASSVRADGESPAGSSDLDLRAAAEAPPELETVIADWAAFRQADR